MNITLEKQAAEAVRDALAALIANEKQSQEKTAADQSALEKRAADRQQGAVKLADYMLAKGMITKEKYAKVVEEFCDSLTTLPYVKKALSLYENAIAGQAKNAQEEVAPRSIGRRAPEQVKTSGDKLSEAASRFEQAIGL